jgi:hypothetical protein
MIYLIITASLHNRLGTYNNYCEDRSSRYKYAIEKSLEWVSEDIQPVIVENNGKRNTPLDDIIWRGNIVPVIYTSNNEGNYLNKGVNELLDIQEVIQRMGIKSSDIIIKLTGRYRLLSSRFIDHVKDSQQGCDLWMKFFNVCSMEFDDNDCILGLYAVRAQYIEWMSYLWLNLFDSAEKGVARYMNRSVPRICHLNHLDLECLFSENGRVVEV